MSVTGMPRKLICVLGLALPVSGAGETSRLVPARVAACSSVLGRHAGEAPLGGTTVRAPEGLPVARTIATAIHAIAAISRTMYPFLLIVCMRSGWPSAQAA